MQSKIDSFMEALVNIAIGMVVSTVANHWVLPGILNVHMTLGQNVAIGAVFTVISIIRSYVLRRAFNGRTVWQAMKETPVFRLFRKKPKPAPKPAAFVPTAKPFLEYASRRTSATVPALRSSPRSSPTPTDASYDPFPSYMAVAAIASTCDSSPSPAPSPSYDSSPSYSSSSSDSGFSSGGGDFGGGGSSGDW